MKTDNPSTEIHPERSVFIETLSAEFFASTGYGAYAYLNPLAIDRLFKQYLKHKSSLREFSKKCVKNHFPF